MIFHPADCNWDEINVLTYACDVLPEARLEIFCYQLLAQFCAEYHMQMVFSEGMCHVSPLRGLYVTPYAPTSHEVGYNMPSLPRLG